MMYFIESQNRLINGEHITQAEFDPAHDVEAHVGDFGEPIEAHHVTARLKIHLLEVVEESILTYDGVTKGGASRAVIVILRGDDAERMKEHLMAGAVRV